MGCYIEFLILKEKILEIAGEEISMPVTVRFNEWDARRRGVMHLCKRNLDALQEELNSKRQPASNKLLEWLHKRRRLFS